ncbi:uncharacterized protein LOC107270394 isoform X2 [Cephus cinctus]|uniref:Uncharacterized protein LOC107270394 isoform X2 n=1 Tax=Cephus cinctus TaxID=211228 RepID=A0AAJ7RM55_CEPCN|nr:uncharacterized protein LOC107270394 isoform X2 [Cephus cinctus]
MSTIDVVRQAAQQSSVNTPDEDDEHHGRTKNEIQYTRRRGQFKSTAENSATQGRKCARCGALFARFHNTGAQCPRCRQRVCQQCRENNRAQGDKGNFFNDWICSECYELSELRVVRDGWMIDGDSKKTVGRKSSPLDILKRSIRRSWTINGPPNRWSAARKSQELRAYRSLPIRRQDYRDIVGESSYPRITNEDLAKDQEYLTGSNECATIKGNENFTVYKKEDEVPSNEITKTKKNDNQSNNVLNIKSGEDQTPPRVSLIKPPRILTKAATPENKQFVKHGERKSNIPILRRSSKEFEDLRSPQESAKRSLIPQRYRGSTDDLRRSREDISVPSLIPKLFAPRFKEDRLKRQDSRDEISPRTKDDRLKRQDSRDEIRHTSKANRRDSKDSKEDSRSFQFCQTGREESKTGIRIFRRDSREDVGRDTLCLSVSVGVLRGKQSSKEDRLERTEERVGEESRSKPFANEQTGPAIRNSKKDIVESSESKNVKNETVNNETNEIANSVEEMKAVKNPQDMADEPKLEQFNDAETNALGEAMTTEETSQADLSDKMKSENSNNCKSEKMGDFSGSVGTLDASEGSDCVDLDVVAVTTPEKRTSFDPLQGKRIDEFQVRRKFSKEEFSNPDDTDDTPNRRCSSHLSPEASPLSTRSSRYSPRESESEPTPALPRKTACGDSFLSSQRIRDAITRTRRESNSSARYESSGSESVKLSESGLHGYTDLARRVKFTGSGTGHLTGNDEVVQRDSATSAGEDEPRDDSHNRDPRGGPGCNQGRPILRRRRQFDSQGSRRRGRSHARGCTEELQSLQTLHVISRGGHRPHSPSGVQGQGQNPEQPIVDYRRLVFISSDSSSGREEDDADSSSGSSSLNGLPRGTHVQGLEDCDWDYFESGAIPLPAGIAINVGGGNIGNENVPQDWSCCPGRGSSACQACGGSRGANVLPVPVPIPVPVPYPVPIPAALWTGEFAASSMISCGTSAEGTLRLRGDPAASWFTWHPRFNNPLQGTRIDPRLTAASFVPVTFSFGPEVSTGFSSEATETKPPETGTSTCATEPNNPVSETFSKVNESGTTNSETTKDETTHSGTSGSNKEEQPSSLKDQHSLEDVAAEDKDCRKKEEDEDKAQNSLSSFKCESRSQKMYRHSRGDSGSSSGRSSADSSDLEDSASHHFSRVFVVNDDSLTSDNDIEDNEDSDSAREGGITLRRVTALPENEPVILRHVRLLDEDMGIDKTRQEQESNDSDTSSDEMSKKRDRTSSEDSAAVVDSPASDRGLQAGGTNENQILRRYNLEASETYVADTKNSCDDQIRLKSIKILDPDSIDSTTSYTLAGKSLQEHYSSSCSSAISKGHVPLTESVSHKVSVTDWNGAIVPDSLEVMESSDIVHPTKPDGTANEGNQEIRGDICEREVESDLPINCDRGTSRADKTISVSLALSAAVHDESLNGIMSNTSTLGISSASSETNTGSEVSSDELHEYELSPGTGAAFLSEGDDRTLSAVNKELLFRRSNLPSIIDKDVPDEQPESLQTPAPDKEYQPSTNESSESKINHQTESESTSGLHSENSDDLEPDSDGQKVLTVTQEKAESAERKGNEECEPVKSSAEPDKSHNVNDIISSKIHEIFKSVESCHGKVGEVNHVPKETTSLAAHDESRPVRGERPDSRQVGGSRDIEGGGCVGSGSINTSSSGNGSSISTGSARETDRGIARFRSVERRPPTRKDGVSSGLSSSDSARDSANSSSNKYRSLVMITQGAYQPVSVVTSDTTTLLQPDEEGHGVATPQGLAGYFQLALETTAESPRGGNGPRRPLMVKRPQQNQQEPEADSGLSVGSASESDDVQSVKSLSRIVQAASGNEQHSPSRPESETSPRVRGSPINSTSNGVVILEEGLADDDSWVEEVSHDEEEQGATTATEESSEDEANNLGDREEELRGYHRQAIDFTLHTIVEESCEESEAEPSLATGSPRKQRPPSASELEKYFFFGLGEGNVSLGSREVDSLSETSSIYSEGLESLGQEEAPTAGDKTSGEFLNSSRLEKYFLSEFLGFDQDRRDSDGSVGSDSEGRPSPEQRRKRLVRARGTGRSHSSSLDNLLALAQSSQNLSSQNSLQDLSLNADGQETQSEGSSTETDGAEDQTPAFGTDGQFDTVKRKKKKLRNLGTQSPRVTEDRNKTPEPREIVESLEVDPETVNSEDERSKTPQPEAALFSSSSSQAEQARNPIIPGEVISARNKQQSRDSGFIGSCDDLLQHQKTTGDSLLSGNQEAKDCSQNAENESAQRVKNNSARPEAPLGQSSLAPPPNASLSRKDSFNNWSSDEETNLMMSKMRQFFKTMVANSNGQNQTSSAASPAPSPRLSGTSPKLRLGSQNRTKPPQLVYFENELTRLMKTVPGIRDEQVREIVEYLSSEDTWSDSYDSSDYTSSDLEGAGAGGRRSALQEQISQSCQQIISKFDTSTDLLSDKEDSAGPPLGRDTAFVYQKLVQSFTKMAGDGVSSDASSTPHSSPPLIAKVMHHIGSRLVALMHEVSEGGPAVQPPASWRRYPQHHRTPSSASTTEDDDSTSDSTNPPAHLQLPRSKSHDPLLLLNGHPAAAGQEGEEREASDYERFSWRGSFESALMAADSRTKLSLLACSGDVSASASASALAMAAKRRSAGDLLFNPKSFSREQLDRVRSCGSIGGGSGSIEEKIWSNRRRSSVPDANTRGESGASAGDDDTEDELEYTGDPRATTLPRGMQAAATASAATNSLPRLPANASAAPGGSSSMHKAHSVHHFLPQHTGVKSARYRPPGFARNSLGNAGVGPKRAVSAPGLQISGSQASAGKRDTSRSRRQQTMSLLPDDGSSLSEACSTPIIGAGSRSSSSPAVDDDMDRGLHSGHLATRASLSSLGARSDSMASVYSGAGEGRWCGSVAVRGEVEFSLQYDYKQLTFEVHVTQCRDLAPVDVKRNRSDPYVKVYLLPDKSKSGKRKTKVKKHTLNPVFDETLKFHMSLNGLETRTLWLTVWHSDMFGRNDFLGEVRMPLENKIFDDPTPKWYSLQERTEPFDDPIAYKGEVIVGLKFVPPDPAQQQEREREHGVDHRGTSKARKNWSRGALHVLVKEARNLQTRAKHNGTCDPFCKSYLLPDKGRSGKQKTGVVRRCSGGSPVWGHTFVYKDVSLQELAERGLELTVWDHDRIASNEFLGGVRFNLGTGKHYGKPVDWMDATGRELSLWQSMLERPNFWVEGAVTLRPNLHNHGRSSAS